MSVSDPVDMLRAGKRVDIDQAAWADEEQTVMKTALREKFSQNPHLHEKLISTGKRHLVEANAYDKHWGVGVGLRDSNLQNKKAWVGKNLLGKLLDKMRKHLKSNDDSA